MRVREIGEIPDSYFLAEKVGQSLTCLNRYLCTFESAFQAERAV